MTTKLKFIESASGNTWGIVVVPEAELNGLRVCERGPGHAHQPALFQPVLGVEPPLVWRPQEGGSVSTLRKLEEEERRETNIGAWT